MKKDEQKKYTSSLSLCVFDFVGKHLQAPYCWQAFLQLALGVYGTLCGLLLPSSCKFHIATQMMAVTVHMPHGTFASVMGWAYDFHSFQMNILCLDNYISVFSPVSHVVIAWVFPGYFSFLGDIGRSHRKIAYFTFIISFKLLLVMSVLGREKPEVIWLSLPTQWLKDCLYFLVCTKHWSPLSSGCAGLPPVFWGDLSLQEEKLLHNMNTHRPISFSDCPFTYPEGYTC